MHRAAAHEETTSDTWGGVCGEVDVGRWTWEGVHGEVYVGRCTWGGVRGEVYVGSQHS